jgi:uncharacterized repeat protein (TIGR01451 family)
MGLRVSAMALAAVASLMWGRAEAMTACQSLITNVATATMSSGPWEFIEYDVSYNATAAVRIKCPASLILSKFADVVGTVNDAAHGDEHGTTVIASTGSTVKFTICAVNTLAFSVWGITITDKLPDNVAFVDMDATWAAGNYYQPTVPGPAPTPSIRYSYNNTWPGTAGAPAAGQGGPLYLRWTLPYIGWTGGGGVKSACLTFRVQIL